MMMSKKTSPPQQYIYDRKVVQKCLDARGNALIAAQDLLPRDQILFIQHPLTLALESKRLEDVCYHCFRLSLDQIPSFFNNEAQTSLKACTGCRTVKFCDRTCQRLAWMQYHKHECPIFAGLHPNVLPTASRAVVTLLVRKQHGLLPPGEWEQLLGLESHLDHFKNAQRQEQANPSWEDLCLMAKAAQSYSRTYESLETVLKLCCILTVNSFTLTNPIFDPLGVVLHPFPARINHSCTPNAYVRFDISAPSSSAGPHPDRHVGRSISIHALTPIKADDEITICYIDTSAPTPQRQIDLSSQYFFNCTCSLCNTPDAVTDVLLPPPSTSPPISLETVSPHVTTTVSLLPTLAPQDAIHRVRKLLGLISLSRRFPPHHYPSPTLRTHLINSYISTSQYKKALYQACLKAYPIDATLYESKQHPTRVMGTWLIYKLARQCVIETFEKDPGLEESWTTSARNGEVKELVGLMVGMLTDLAETVLGEKWETTFKDFMSGIRGSRGKDGKARAKDKDEAKEPPPYVGPEEPPQGLPGYAESDAGSRFGVFEQMVANALDETINGDGKMFWDEFKAGGLPSDGDYKMAVAGKIMEIIREEERFAELESEGDEFKSLDNQQV